MGLQSLVVHDFRNITRADLDFSSTLNLISGHNAAGKTSLLEAIYCLGRVRSFRTSSLAQPIRYGQPAFRLVGRVALAQDRSVPVGIERRQEGLRVHLAGQPIRRLSDLAGKFPVQVFSGDTQTILSGGPRYRRQSLDWALFHVEPGYRDSWQRYARALRQRNAALRDKVPSSQISVWDPELLESAGRIDQFRRSYFDSLHSGLVQEINELLGVSEVAIRYQAGWQEKTGLADMLVRSLEKDCHLGYTQYGPHRADFSLQVNGRAVPAHLSRGQQKAVTVAFLLAQLKLQQARGVAMGAFLLDDLGSELDNRHQMRMLAALQDLGTQVFVTTIDSGFDALPGWQDSRRFHVEHGEVTEVV